MLHEKIIKRDDGTEIKILIDFYVDFRAPHWSPPTISVKDKGKTKFYTTPYYTENLVTNQEILDAALELWHKLKPTF
jgi:hypothetical protein